MRPALQKKFTAVAGLFLLALVFLLWRRGYFGFTPLQVLLPGFLLTAGWVFLLAAFWFWRKARRQLCPAYLWRGLLAGGLLLLLLPYSLLGGQARLLLFRQLPLPGTESSVKAAYQQLLENPRWQTKGRWWQGYTLTVGGNLAWDLKEKRPLTITYQADKRGGYLLEKTLLDGEEMPTAFAAFIQERLFSSGSLKGPIADDLALWLLKNSRFANCEISLEELVKFSINDARWTSAYFEPDYVVELAGRMIIAGTLREIRQSYLVDITKCTIEWHGGMLGGNPQSNAAYEQWCKELVKAYAKSK